MIFFWYFVLAIIGMFVSYWEFRIYKEPLTKKDIIQIIACNIFAWYIFTPWTIGDYIYKKMRRKL